MRKVPQGGVLAGVLAGVVSLVVLVMVVMRSDSDTGQQNDTDFVAFERAQQAETLALQQEPGQVEGLPTGQPTNQPTGLPTGQPLDAHVKQGAPTQDEAKNPVDEPGLKRASAAHSPQLPFGDDTFREVPAPDDWKPSIPRDVIENAIEAIKPAAQQCYDSLLQDFPDANGTVQVRFIFKTEDGMARVQMSEIMENSTLFDSSLHDCLSEVVGSLTLPRAENDMQVMVAHPFHFRADPSGDK